MVVEGGFDVLVVGGASMDYLARAPSLPRPGTAVQGSEFEAAPGAKGVNQAVAAARLGARTGFVGRIGADEPGSAIFKRLCDEGVDTRGVVRDSTGPSGTALVMVDHAGEKQMLSVPGVNLNVTIEDIRVAGELIASAKIVIVSVEVPLEAVGQAIRLARAAGAGVMLDPAPVALPDDLVGDADVVRANAIEAEALTGVIVHDRTSAREAAANLLGRGAASACISAPGGSLLVSPEAEEWVAHLPVQVVDTTGAGDAFVAALAVALAKERPLREAALFANGAAALSTTRLGAQASLPHLQAVNAFLTRLNGEPS
jgi:ribokinase